MISQLSSTHEATEKATVTLCDDPLGLLAEIVAAKTTPLQLVLRTKAIRNKLGDSKASRSAEKTHT